MNKIHKVDECRVSIEVHLKENEEINDLEYRNWKIIQNRKEFCFGVDSVLLSDFAKSIKPGSKVLDLGTGTGIIGMLLCGKSRLKSIIGIEIQEHVANMANRSIKLNGLEDKFQIINEDIRNLENIFEKQSIDVIVTNPPYKKKNTGLINKNEAKLISRHEVKCTLEEIIKVSVNLLKYDGTFYMVHRPERLVDILFYLRQYKLEPKLIRFVHSRENKPPKLVLIKCVKNANQFLKIDKPLIIYKENGEYTGEILKIYDK